jgi:hypothetical protein
MIAEDTAHRAHPGGERWGPPHSLPLQCRASTALAGWGHVPSPVPPQRAEVTGGAAHVPPPCGGHGRASTASRRPSRPRARRAAWRMAEGAVSAIRARRVREAKWSGREPGAGPGPGGGAARNRGGAKTTAPAVNEERETRDPSRAHGPDMRSGEVRAASRVDPGGGAARLRSGVKAATATVVEEREPRSRARPAGPERRSDEARAACRGDPPAAAPRARGAERRRAGPRAGPRRPNPARGTVLKGVSAEGQKGTGWGRGVSKGR